VTLQGTLQSLLLSASEYLVLINFNSKGLRGNFIGSTTAAIDILFAEQNEEQEIEW